MMSRKLSVLFSSAKQINATVTILVGLFLVAGGWAYGQDVRASLGGRVTDAQGAIIPKATVAVTADETGVVQTTSTNSAGDWVVLTLLPGHYHFQVKAPGFKTEERTSIELQVGDKKYVDTQMQVGTVSQSVTVETTTPLIDLTSSASGSVITLAELEEIPTQSNAPTMDVAVLPGVTIGLGVGGGTYLWSNSGLSGTTVNGAGGGLAGAIAYTLDGGSVNYNSSNDRLAFEPPMDAVNEMKMVTNGYDASLGRGSAATEMLSLKSGAEKFHGDLYETNQGTYLNANSYQYDASHTPQSPIHTNEYGGSVGGPVWIPKLYDGRKMKTFFYFSYAGIRNIGPVSGSVGLATVPSLLERAGNFSQSTVKVSGVTYPVQLFNPYSSTVGKRVPFSCSTYGTGTLSTTCEAIPSTYQDPMAQLYYSMMPAPEFATDNAVSSDSDNYQNIAEQSDKFHGYTVRVDQTENNKNHTYVDLYYNNFTELSYTGFGTAVTTTATAAGLTTGNPVPIQGRYQARTNKGLGLDHDIALNERLLLDLNYHAMSYFAGTWSPGSGISPTTVGFPSSYGAQMQVPSIPQVTGFTSSFGTGSMGSDSNSQGNAPLDINQDMNVSLTQTHKNHNFHYGWEYMIQQEGNSSLPTPGGVFAFPSVGANGNYTSEYGTGAGTNGSGYGSPIADFYMGLPGSTSQMPTSATSFFSQHYTAFYFQDDWRYTPKLTLNLGLRWDYERPTTERFNRFFSQYNPTAPQTAVTAAALPGYTADYGGSGSGTTATSNLLFSQWGTAPGAFQVMGGPEYAGLNGTSRYETAPRYKYFQPRIGFAYQLTNKTVIRGGVGRFVQADFNPISNQTGFSSSTPYCASACSNYNAVGQTWDNPYPAGLVAPVGNSMGLQTNVGSPEVTATPTYTAFNIGRVYVDTATLGVQRQIKDYLFEVTGLFNATHGLALGIPINLPSAGAWYAENTPNFSPLATSPQPVGAPQPNLPGATPVQNPFKGVANVWATETGASTETASQLLRPNPSAGDIYLNSGDGKIFYYALNTKVEKRFTHGFSILQSFSYSKQISENDIYNQNDSQAVAVKIEKRLATGDQRFHYELAPVYELPFGRGKRFLNNFGGGGVGWAMEELVGGWEFSGIYNFQSGVPVVFPTNSSFFQGTDPKPVGQKSHANWFDTTKFAIFPSSSVTNATLANTMIYPAWTGVTGMPGAGYVPASGAKIQNGVYNDFATWNTYFPTTFGDIRQPYTTAFTLGARKSFLIAGPVRFQIRMDVFNALNHPLFASVNTTVGNTYFGTLGSGATLSQTNSPRQVQLSGRLSF
jgi:hypothetical protein